MTHPTTGARHQSARRPRLPAALVAALVTALALQTALAIGPNTPGDLLVNGLAKPAFVDIDADGDQDAFVGDVFNGKVRFYRNEGTPQAPFFRRVPDSQNPLANANSSNVQVRAAPAFIDIDADGDKDVFIGSGVLSPMIFFRNTGSRTSPNFVQVSGPANPLEGAVIQAGTPAFGDLDNDGDFDMVSGENEPGQIYYYRNTGTPAAPAFSLVRGSNPAYPNPWLIPAPNEAKPESVTSLADIDGDGDLDLFVGSRGGQVFFFRNTKNSTAPGVDASFVLDEAGDPLAGITDGTTESSALGFVDIDADGDLDVYAGDTLGVGRLYRNTGSAASPSFALQPAENPFVDVSLAPSTSIAAADVDGDGDRDVVIGSREENERLAYFENTGSGFTRRTGAQNPFSAIVFGAGVQLNPTFADLDDDGDQDLVLGTSENDPLRYYRNGTTGTSGSFAVPPAASDPFDNLTPTFADPIATFGDLDGDGDLDMIVGTSNGATTLTSETPLFFRNTGTATLPAFTYELEDVTNSIFFPGFRTVVDNSGNEGDLQPSVVENFNLAPELIDYDGDGDLDLLIGQRYGYFLLLRNVSQGGDIIFQRDDANNPFLTGSGTPLQTFDFSSYVRSASFDYDGDGDLDTFVGSELGNIRFMRNLAAPAAPYLVAGAGASSITLSWSVAVDPEHPNTPTGYSVERSPNGTAWTEIGMPAGGLTGSFVDSSPLMGVNRYRVRALYTTDSDPNTNTVFGAYSNVASAATSATLGAPTGLAANDAAGPVINLTWADNSTTETGFRVERSPNGVTGWEVLTTTAAGATSYSDATVESGATYSYRVFAVTATNSSPSSNIATDSTPLAAPASLAAKAISAVQVDLSWGDTNGGETGFRVERSPNGVDGWTPVATTAPNVMAYNDTGLAGGTTYFYRVVALRGAETSAASNVASATTPLAAPSALSVTVISSTQLDVSWTDNSTNETGFQVERSPNGVDGWVQIGSVGPNVTTYSDTGLTNATAYYYRVRAVRNAEVSTYSNTASATTGMPLAPPTNLTATTASLSQINLSWTDNTADETGFRVERSANGVDGWAIVGTTAANATTYSDTGLTAGTTYYYRVRAVRNTETSAPSNVASAITGDVPATPANLTATAISDDQIDLSWTDASNDETGFQVERSANGVDGWVQIGTVGPNVTTFSNTGLTAGTTYYYRVRAVRNAEVSAYSNTASATTTGVTEYIVNLPVVVNP